MRALFIQKTPRHGGLKSILIRGSISAMAMLLLLTSSPVRADLINFISSTGHITASGLAGNSDGKTSYSDTRATGTASGTAIWPSPNGLASSTSYASSSATQNSSFGTAGIAVSQQIQFGIRTPLAGGGFAQAIAESVFQVSFTVSQAVMFELTLSRNPGFSFFGFYNDTFSLNSINFTSGTFSGLLIPGETYIFTASQRFFGGPQDPIGNGNQASSTVQMMFTTPPESMLAVVPESGGFVCLLLGVSAIAAYHRLKTRKGPAFSGTP
jgi:hypothetical protein